MLTTLLIIIVVIQALLLWQQSADMNRLIGLVRAASDLNLEKLDQTNHTLDRLENRINRATDRIL